MQNIIMTAFFGFFLCGVPILLTVYNILIFSKKISRGKYFPKKGKLFDLATIIYGFVLLYGWIAVFCGEKEWYKPVILGGGNTSNHTPISDAYSAMFYLPVIVGGVFLLMMLYGKKKRPPLITVIMITVIMIANFDLFMLVVQLLYPKNTHTVYFLPPLVYALNYLLVTVRAMRKEISSQLEYLSYNKENGSGLSHKLYKILDKSYKWVLAGFILLLPVAAIFTIVFVLAGEGADGVIKEFTETADWTFSTKTPPPPEYYKGHYLCTVAAGGHRRIVKPTRFGVRRGERIIVNRQLCIANAFEELIKDKTPRFHKAVRSFYDKHGYPVSKKITTKTRADIVYLLMKPLEWLFLLTLYMFDTYPERRIALQYTGRTLSNI
ncbi:MAG TPA: hypothetical protein DCO93_04910 [Clostridiales bacterium]|nr:hypothetical protein [Clostridiales bacterium]